MTPAELAAAWRGLGQPMTDHDAEDLLSRLTPEQADVYVELVSASLAHQRAQRHTRQEDRGIR